MGLVVGAGIGGLGAAFGKDGEGEGITGGRVCIMINKYPTGYERG
jgi:hypothetical protein